MRTIICTLILLCGLGRLTNGTYTMDDTLKMPSNKTLRGLGTNTIITVNSCSGSVWAYNFATNCQTFNFFFQSGFLQHGGFPNMNLYEGRTGL